MDKNAKIKIEYEISRIEKSIGSVKPLLDLCKIKVPDIIEMTAAAQVLHSFYNRVESIIVLLFKNMNEKLPNDIKWHKSLFDMAIIDFEAALHISPDYAIARRYLNIAIARRSGRTGLHLLN